jgi:hypothetical protein
MHAATQRIEELKRTALSLSIELQLVSVRRPQELSAAFASVRQKDAQAVYLMEEALFFAHRTTLCDLAFSHRLPTVY